MLRIAFISAPIFGILFFILFPSSGTEFPNFSFLWRYNLRGGNSLAVNSSSADGGASFPRPFFNGLLLQQDTQEVLFTPSGEEPVASGQLLFVPFLGDGYFAYRKIGTNISYHTLQGEELWKREQESYPVSDSYGKLVLLVSGDNSRVDLIDYNGVSVGAKTISGNFLTDYCFAARNSIGSLLFSDGAWYILQEGGKLVAKYRDEEGGEEREGDVPFFKSCALGPDGHFLALHALIGGRDTILLFSVSEQGIEKLREVTLPAVYPHLLHMAVNRLGVLVAAPDRTLFFKLSAQQDWQRGYKGNKIFRPLFAGQDFFLYGEDNMLVVTDGEAHPIASLFLDIAEDSLWRILPGKRAGLVALQLPDHLDFFQYISNRAKK